MATNPSDDEALRRDKRREEREVASTGFDPALGKLERHGTDRVGTVEAIDDEGQGEAALQRALEDVSEESSLAGLLQNLESPSKSPGLHEVQCHALTFVCASFPLYNRFNARFHPTLGHHAGIALARRTSPGGGRLTATLRTLIA